MEWFFFAIAAPVFLAMSNIVDKIMFTRYRHDPFSFQVIMAISNLPFMVGYFFLARPVFDAFSLIAMGVGVLTFFSYVIFNKCMLREEASRVMSLSYLQPIFLLLLGFAVLGESSSLLSILGIFLLICSALLVSYKKIGKKFRLSGDVLKMMIAFDIMVSVSYIIVRWATGFASTPPSPYDMLFWMLCGGQLVAYPFLLASKNTKTAFLKEVRKMSVGGWAFRIFGTAVDLLGFAMLYVALSLNNAAEVSAITAIQPFLVFVYSVMLFKISPKTIQEDLRSISIIQKIAAFILIIIGSWLVVS